MVLNLLFWKRRSKRRNMWNKLILVLAVVVFVLGCKSKKEIAKAVKPEKTESSKNEVLMAVRENQLDFTTLSMKAKADLSIDNRKHDVSMNIRMKKDEVIWVSVTVIAGIEVARAMITPDSIKILNRMESTYVKKPFSYLYQYANEQLSFRTLQTLLVGNSDPAFISDNTDVSIQKDNQVLSGMIDGLAYSLALNENNKIVQTSLKDHDARQQLTAEYGSFYTVGGQTVPYTITIKSAAGDNRVNISLNYSQVTVDEQLDFPFSIPKRFTIQD